MSNKNTQLKKSSLATRIGFAFAALMCAIGTGLHIRNWLRGTTFDIPVAASMMGLTILMTISALDLSRGGLRMSLAGIALLLIFGGFIAQMIPTFIH